MDEFTYELKINKDRVAVLIGKEGAIKKEIEAATSTAIRVDSKEGDIFVKGADGLGLYTATNIIRAIGRGFNPEIALSLLKPEYSFEVIDLSDYAGKSKNTLTRIKGRIIGMEGKTRRLLEQLKETNVSVYGKTVAIIGETSYVYNCRIAIDSLASGSPHSKVYRWLEKKRTELKRAAILGDNFTYK